MINVTSLYTGYTPILYHYLLFVKSFSANRTSCSNSIDMSEQSFENDSRPSCKIGMFASENIILHVSGKIMTWPGAWNLIPPLLNSYPTNRCSGSPAKQTHYFSS